ncbi:GNAT family N-acetyltransferase [Galactobacter valiniphilus]|uniref:GNAT family N-acetyltransferase n=1 Tax=Galactobacter valiniphilus TaxID=2676122 RepID=UPI0037361EC1
MSATPLGGTPAPSSPSEVESFLELSLVDEPAGVAAVRRASVEAGLPDEASAPARGKFLSLLTRLSGARRILEIGTLGGYAAAWILDALPEDGHLHSLEIDRDIADVARANLRLADPEGEGHRWTVETGPAVKALHQLTWTRQAPFDLVFIDADKASTKVYLEWALRLTAPGSVVIVDHVIRAGVVGAEAGGSEADAEAAAGMAAALKLLHEDPRFDATALQTVTGRGWDGFAIALVTGAAAPGSAAQRVTVTPMDPETVRGALEVKNLGWRETFSKHIAEDWLDDMDRRLDADVVSWTRALQRPGNLTRTAVATTEDGEVVGMASAAPVLEESDRLATGAKWELFTVYVARAWQGSGIARRLADSVLGDEPALLWVLEDNPRAQAFFEKLGFTPDGAREELPPEWSGAHDIRMVRRA